MSEDNIKELVKSWYTNKGKNETDPYFKLLCLWICFNAWLSFSTKKNSDSEMLEILINNRQNYDLIRAYENMSQTDTGKKALKDMVSMSPIGDARGIRNGVLISNSEDKENIIWGIYRVRCNLFHGGKAYEEQRNRKLVTCVNRVLDKWISELLALW